MTKPQKLEVQLYEEVCDLVARKFAKKYFGKDADYYWIADEIGGVIEIADRFYSITDMVEFIRYKYSAKMMFRYYDEKLDADMKGKEFPYNIYSYKKLCKNK